MAKPQFSKKDYLKQFLYGFGSEPSKSLENTLGLLVISIARFAEICRDISQKLGFVGEELDSYVRDIVLIHLQIWRTGYESLLNDTESNDSDLRVELVDFYNAVRAIDEMEDNFQQYFEELDSNLLNLLEFISNSFADRSEKSKIALQKIMILLNLLIDYYNVWFEIRVRIDNDYEPFQVSYGDYALSDKTVEETTVRLARGAGDPLIKFIQGAFK